MIVLMNTQKNNKKDLIQQQDKSNFSHYCFCGLKLTLLAYLGTQLEVCHRYGNLSTGNDEDDKDEIKEAK